jgi:hypothetical protein
VASFVAGNIKIGNPRFVSVDGVKVVAGVMFVDKAIAFSSTGTLGMWVLVLEYGGNG